MTCQKKEFERFKRKEEKTRGEIKEGQSRALSFMCLHSSFRLVDSGTRKFTQIDTYPTIEVVQSELLSLLLVLKLDVADKLSFPPLLSPSSSPSFLRE